MPDFSEEHIAFFVRVKEQDRKPPKTGGKVDEVSLSPASDGFLYVLLFGPKNEGDMSIRNVELSLNNTTLQAKTSYSS
jgi:hypothetical protein